MLLSLTIACSLLGLLFLTEPTQAAEWAIEKGYNTGDCSGAVTSASKPNLLGTCVLRYRGTPDVSLWVYVKSTCSGGQLVSTCYSEATCTTVSTSDDTSLCYDSGPTVCTTSSSNADRSSMVSCDNSASVVTAALHQNRPGSACVAGDGTYVGDQTYPLDMCFMDDSLSEYVKATCVAGVMTATKYGADDTSCSGAGTLAYTIGQTCQRMVEGSSGSSGAIKSGCGDGYESSGSEDADAESASASRASERRMYVSLGLLLVGGFSARLSE